MWIKVLRQRKLQSFLIFLIAMLCSTILAGSMSILFSLEKPFEDFVKECKSPCVRIYPYDNSKESIQILKKELESQKIVKGYTVTNDYRITENIKYNQKKIEAYVLLMEYNKKLHGNFRFISKKVSQPKSGECFIPAVLSNKYKIKIGDYITINTGEKESKYKVAAIVSDPYNSSLAFTIDIIVDKIPDGLPKREIIHVYSNSNKTGADVERSIREDNNGEFPASVQTLEDRINNSQLVGKIMGAILFGAGIFVLLISTLIIRFMIKNVMISDSKSIAIYKTLGYQSKDILNIYMKLYFILVSVGCITGIQCSILISNYFLSSAFSNIGAVKGGSNLIPGVMCYGIIVTVVIISVYQIVSKLKKLKPVTALAGVENDLGKKKSKRYKELSSLSFSPFGIAVRMIQRDKKNVIGIILTCIITIYSINFAFSAMMAAGDMVENNYYWLGFDKCDLVIKVSDSTDFNTIYQKVKKNDNIKKIIRFNNSATGYLKWEKGMVNPSVDINVLEIFENLNMPVIEGRNPKYKNEIALSPLVADRLNKSVGDYIDMNLDSKHKVSFLITGTYQSFYDLGNSSRMLSNSYTLNKIDFDYTEMSVYLKNGTNVTNSVKQLQKQLGNRVKVVSRYNYNKNIMDMITIPQQKAIPPFMALIMAIGSINIFCIVLLKNQNNQRNNGIYKAIGYSSYHLLKSNIWFMGLIGLLSIVVTLPIFFSTYPKIMVLCLSMFGFKKFPVEYHIGATIVLNSVVFSIFILSSILSSLSLFKINTKDLISE